MERPLRTRLIRLTAAVLAVLAVVVLPVAPWVVPVLAGAVIAYDGPSSRAARGLIGGIVVAELLGVATLGAWSLPVAFAALVWQLLARVVPLAPWAAREGWSPVDAAVTILAAAALAVVVSAGSAAFMALTGDAGLNLRLGGAPRTWWPAFLIAAAVTVALLRRLDTPLRRAITFGQ